ncbi:Ran-binding domain [Tritrichomonas musculus]|uniref:Ran-binding domain n=1 Tax=Tritrichomonas musculus TaxID=1915356 RepID=A0ABR2KR96_9EUKA
MAESWLKSDLTGWGASGSSGSGWNSSDSSKSGWGNSGSSGSGWGNSGSSGSGWNSSDSSKSGWGNSGSSGSGWNSSDSSKSGWGNSGSSEWSAPSSKGWGDLSSKGWGDSSSKDCGSSSSSEWGTPSSKGWGDPSSNGLSNDASSATSNKSEDKSKPNILNGWERTATVPSNKDSETKASGNGWGKVSSGSSWGQGNWKGAEIVNPFRHKDDSEPSEQKFDMYAAFGVDRPKPAIIFNFGTDKEFQTTHDPNTPFNKDVIKYSSFQMPTPPPQTQKSESNNDEDDDSKEFEIVEEKTGEEDEEILFNEKSRALVIKKDENGKPTGYSEIGVGEFHLNYDKNNNIYRMTMRRDLQNIVLNSRIFKEMRPTLSKKVVRFMAQNSEGKLEIKAFAFENEEKAKKLYDTIVDVISKIK